MSERPYTAKQVPEHLSLGVPTVYGYLRSGKLGHFRLPDGSYRIRPEHLKAFEEQAWDGPSSSDPTTGSNSKAPSGISPGPKAGSRDPFQLGSASARQPRSSSTASSPAPSPQPSPASR